MGQGGRTPCAPPACSLGFPPRGMPGAEPRDADVLNIKAAGQKRVWGLLFTGRGGGKGGGWVANRLQSQEPVNKFCIRFTFRRGFIP